MKSNPDPALKRSDSDVPGLAVHAGFSQAGAC
jgi:hypothetical protein